LAHTKIGVFKTTDGWASALAINFNNGIGKSLHMKDINQYKLTGHITVGHLKQWMAARDDESKEKIVELIHHRFYNRYLKHAAATKSGFLKMALSCLLIEALQSFKQGINNTHGKSKQMFVNFFTEESANFPGFAAIAGEFFTDIRCGILHQAETTNAWRILLSGKLLDPIDYSIDANKFVLALKRSLNDYTASLRQEEFSSRYWRHALTKLEDICENCERK
jgi:hypothetical protein